MRPNLGFLDRISILVVGDVMLDRYLWGDVHRISPEAPVPVVEVARETCTAGGAANVLLNLSALGVRCELFGLVGDDANGDELCRLLAERGVPLDPRLRRPNTPTITKTRIVAQRQQICRLDRESDPEVYAVTDPALLALLAEKAVHFDAVILSDYAKGSVTQEVVDVLRQVRARCGNLLALDPKPTHPLEIGGLDLLTPNRGEAVQLAGLTPREGEGLPYEEIGRRVLERHHPKRLVMTLSERGMLLQEHGGSARLFPTLVRQVADVSGAGDTVMAALTAGIAGGLSSEEAVQLANAAAGVVVAKLGTSTLTRAELSHALPEGALAS